jgi:IS30 family transposase
VRAIARTLNRSPSSVSREISRNKPPFQNRYTPRVAHDRALAKRNEGGRKERLKNNAVRSYVIRHLKERWSPEQIAGRIRIDMPGTGISHEAVYQYVYAQVNAAGWGLVRKGSEDLRPFLRNGRKRRIKKGMRRCGRTPKFEGISIDERPATVDQRSRVGDWEGDTVASRNHKPGVNTVVERKTGLVFVTKLAGRDGRATADAVNRRFASVPARLRRTLTLDNGPENGSWRDIEKGTGMRCFFAHPYHSWERGTNENTNGLLRQYFPKKTDFTLVSEEELRKVEYDLNSRPRKRLQYKTPLEVWGVALEG